MKDLSEISNSEKREKYIGVFDSGVGGVSILKRMTELLPGEKFVYYGDSAHAPYGEKAVEEVRQLSLFITEKMLQVGVKALVIACNTATSAAGALLRERYPQLPIIGVEPAIKPAAEQYPDSRVLVMATPVTLHLEKFRSLSERLAGKTEFLPVECPGLAAAIEKGDPDSREIHSLLHQFLDPYIGRADALVLGCTHYPFIRKQIREVLGNIPMFDSADGTARELRRVLAADGLLRDGTDGTVVFDSSRKTTGELAVYRRFYRMEV